MRRRHFLVAVLGAIASLRFLEAQTAKQLIAPNPDRVYFYALPDGQWIKISVRDEPVSNYSIGFEKVDKPDQPQEELFLAV